MQEASRLLSPRAIEFTTFLRRVRWRERRAQIGPRAGASIARRYVGCVCSTPTVTTSRTTKQGRSGGWQRRAGDSSPRERSLQPCYKARIPPTIFASSVGISCQAFRQMIKRRQRGRRWRWSAAPDRCHQSVVKATMRSQRGPPMSLSLSPSGSGAARPRWLPALTSAGWGR